MKRLGIGLSFAAAVGLVACASEEVDEGLLGGKAGGGHVGNAGRGGSASNMPGSGGHVSRGGAPGSVAGTSSSGAGVPGVGGSTGVGGTVGASGGTGLGGSAGNAASGGGSPVFESGTCANSPSMSLSYQQKSSNPKQITALYQFSNTTDTPIPLAQLKIRYFFSNEETSGWSTAIYDAKLEGGTGNYRPITGPTLVVSPLGVTVPGADSYLELSFGNSALSIEKGATGTVSWDLQPKSYNPPDQLQTDDYSYNAAAVASAVWDHVVIYQGTTLIWGCTPKEAGGNGGAGGVGGSGAGSGSGGVGGSSAGSGGDSSAGTSGTAGASAGNGGTSNGGTSGTTSGGASGSAGSIQGGASGSSGAGGSQVNAGTGGSTAGSSGSAGSI
jgi:hypothetical protein